MGILSVRTAVLAFVYSWCHHLSSHLFFQRWNCFLLLHDLLVLSKLLFLMVVQLFPSDLCCTQQVSGNSHLVLLALSSPYLCEPLPLLLPGHSRKYLEKRQHRGRQCVGLLTCLLCLLLLMCAFTEKQSSSITLSLKILHLT